MKTNYRKLGKFIGEVNNRDKNLSVDLLLGVSIQKKFMPSIANTIGTDMSTYKIIKKNQFAYGPVTSRNGDKISIALLSDYNEAIVSQAYTPFEVIDADKLHPEYLMMWFRRPEFDRYARFMSHGSAREIFGWEEMCNTELPIPSIEKQREIIAEYNTIVNRININKQLIAKLEQTAQAIYKQWFVDFEFPDADGKPYKSGGGEMIESELGEIPKGWEVTTFDRVVKTVISNRGKSKSVMNLNPKDKHFKYPVISAMNVSNGSIVKHNTISYADKDTYNEWMKIPLTNGDVIMTSEAPLGELFYISNRTDYLLSQRLFAIRANKTKMRGIYLYFWLQTPFAKNDLLGRATGTTVAGIKLSELLKLTILEPPLQLTILFENLVQKLLVTLDDKQKENELLNELRDLLLSKLATIND